MSRLKITDYLWLLTTVGFLTMGGFSCGKQKQSTAAPTETPPAVETNAPAAEITPAPSRAIPVASAPIPSSQGTVDAVDAAIKAKQYETAAETILVIQRQKQLTDQQAEAVRARMIQLQSALAGAIASGDPKAKAAAELLRQSSKF